MKLITSEKIKVDFPSLSYVFRNNGEVSSYLRKFSINVISKELDKKALLHITYGFERIKNQYCLCIIAFNCGWGNDWKGNLIIKNRILEKLFKDLNFTFTGIIKSGEKKKILILNPNKIDIEFFKFSLKGKFENYLIVDEVIIEHNGGLKKLSTPIDKRLTISTEDGFNFKNSAFHSQLFSDVTYCALINFDEVETTKEYKISREIKPGDLDRFHIKIGTTKSAKLKIQFEFTSDQNKVITSEIFNLIIENPRNSIHPNDFKDNLIAFDKRISFMI